MPRVYVHKAVGRKAVIIHINKSLPTNSAIESVALEDAKIIHDVLYRTLTVATYNKLFNLMEPFVRGSGMEATNDE